MSTPRNHHFVPQFLLTHFANESGQLSVFRLDREDAHPASPRTLGYREFGHTIFRPGREPDHGFEIQMGSIEGSAANAIERLQNDRRPISDDEREILAWFFALQWSRHRLVLTTLRSRAMAHIDTDATLQEQRSGGLIAVLGPLLHAWEAREDRFARPKDQWNGIVSALMRMDWKVQRYSTRALVIGDNVVCLSGLADGHAALAPAAWAQHGVGVGFESCKRVTAPLAPNLGVLLTREEYASRVDAAVFNRYSIYNSREWVAVEPEWVTSKPRLFASAIEQLRLQRFLRPAMGQSD